MVHCLPSRSRAACLKTVISKPTRLKIRTARMNLKPRLPLLLHLHLFPHPSQLLSRLRSQPLSLPRSPLRRRNLSWKSLRSPKMRSFPQSPKLRTSLRSPANPTFWMKPDLLSPKIFPQLNLMHLLKLTPNLPTKRTPLFPM